MFWFFTFSQTQITYISTFEIEFWGTQFILPELFKATSVRKVFLLCHKYAFTTMLGFLDFSRSFFRSPKFLLFFQVVFLFHSTDSLCRFSQASYRLKKEEEDTPPLHTHTRTRQECADALAERHSNFPNDQRRSDSPVPGHVFCAAVQPLGGMLMEVVLQASRSWRHIGWMS